MTKLCRCLFTAIILIAYSSPTLAGIKKPKALLNAPAAKKGTGTFKIKQPKVPPTAPDAKRGTGTVFNFCSSTNYGIDLTPLIPQSTWGYTASQTPVVWVHISYEKNPSNPLSGELSVLDKQGNLIKERQKVEIPNTSGAFSLQLPELPQSNQVYDWILQIECGNNQNTFFSNYVIVPSISRNSSKYAIIMGSIYQRQFDDLIKLKPEERISFYLKKGIWYDALNEAANLYCQDSRFWQELLTQEKLEIALKEPIKCSKY
ncbi:DUF928 domain-containing protein [Aphanizomenon sp. CS-733/32]|uniref:DUF928 domain-containing protein n=1 Tax=Aphanizomenon sp. CS-733/32 TaxID=3021715 RepID=UPI00232F9741|nr:DUF928 domain-containing protein [Aphanizomenon sp. CS-733/32]MDB9307434.1 DUF928 domain-containing protein [Aphanizomenon sp. CS-733/32]